MAATPNAPNQRNLNQLKPGPMPLSSEQVDIALEACLKLQHAGTTLHNKMPLPALLLAPDNSTIPLTHFGLGTVRHAESEVARLASAQYNATYLWGCTLVSTWEPCVMCTGTLYWAHIGRLLYAASEKSLHKLTGDDNGENMTMSLPCREVLRRGQKDVEVTGPINSWEKRTVEESRKWWKEHSERSSTEST